MLRYYYILANKPPPNISQVTLDMSKSSTPQENPNYEKMPTSVADIIAQATFANTEQKIVLAAEKQELSKAELDLLARMGDVSAFGVDALADKLGLSESKPTNRSCSIGMGCEDVGVCYAAAMDCPERCGRE